MRSILLSSATAIVLLTSTARVAAADDAPCECSGCIDDDAVDLRREEAAADARATVGAQEAALGLALFIPAYAGGTAYAFVLPDRLASVDAIPIVGAIAAGARDRDHVNRAALFFSGGVQLIGAVVAIIGAATWARAQERRFSLAASGGPGHATVGLVGRW